MNTPTTSTPDLEALRQAVQTYRPNPQRVPYNDLKPVHDSIAELRRQNASYATIADLLQQHGIKTNRARVTEYGRIVLEGGKSRKRRKRAKAMPAVKIPAQPKNALPEVAIPASALPAPTAEPAGNMTMPPTWNSPYRSREPHIANVRMMTPKEAKAFNEGLKRPGS